MTTIAFRAGIMAADSQCTGSDIRRGEVDKLWRLDDGGVFAMAGASGLSAVIAEWLSKGAALGDRPKLPDGLDVHGIYAATDGRVAILSNDLVLQWVDAPFHALGSGNEIAMGAMAMGATAEQAVACAARFDVFTGGPVRIMVVGRPRP